MLFFIGYLAREDNVDVVEVEGYQGGGVDLGMRGVGKGNIYWQRGGYRRHGDMI